MDVRFDGAHREKQPRGDVLVTQAPRDEGADLLLARAENHALNLGSIVLRPAASALLPAHMPRVLRDPSRLLFGSVVNLTGYRKYGEPLELYQRYAEAFDIPSVESISGDAPAEALALDD